ncbi:MAG TPA: HlyD family efflux transporter periplasmic adaptor subunit [Thermoanaerobaculia bacterium]
MDREISPGVRRRALIRRLTLALIVVAAAGFTLAATVDWLRPSLRRNEVTTAIVANGDVEAVVQASGIVVPQDEQAVSSPVDARVLRIHRRAGDAIKAGDELITLDTAAVSMELSQLDEKLEQRQKDAERLRLQLEEQLAALKAGYEAKKVDAEILRLKAERSAKLRREGLVSEQDALLDAAESKKMALELVQTEESIARAIRSGAAQIAADALDTSMLRKQREESRRQLDLAMMRAPRAGVVTAIVQEEGATVRNGEVLARIADLSSFRVVATVSDLYVPRIAAGMPVRVRVDDATVVRGTLATIDPRIENGIARIHIALDASAHARLRNNLRVDVFVVTNRRHGVVQVKRGALAQASAEDVFVVRDGRLVRTRVRWGATGEENVEVASGLAAGDEVVISDMKDYEGLKEIRLR